MDNKKTLSFQIIYGKVYNVVWEGVSIVDTLIANIGLSISHVFSSSAIANIIHNIDLSIGITGSTKGLIDLTHTLAQNISQTFIIREVLKIVFTNTIAVTNSFVFKEILKAQSTITKTIGVSITPVLAVVNTLLSFDPDALSTMDTETLVDLDYTVV